MSDFFLLELAKKSENNFFFISNHSFFRRRSHLYANFVRNFYKHKKFKNIPIHHHSIHMEVDSRDVLGGTNNIRSIFPLPRWIIIRFMFWIDSQNTKAKREREREKCYCTGDQGWIYLRGKSLDIFVSRTVHLFAYVFIFEKTLILNLFAIQLIVRECRELEYKVNTFFYISIFLRRGFFLSLKK